MQKDRADNQEPQGEKPAVEAGHEPVDELMEAEFEEIDSKPGEDEGKGEGDQSGGEGGSGGEEPPATPEPKRKWGGQFDTPEDLEAAYIRSLQAQSAESAKLQPKAEELPNLTEQELVTMREQDETDGTKFLEEYLRRKMQERNLERHEVAAARKIDAEQGTDLLGDYYELRVLRRVKKETAPLVRRSREESQRAFYELEASIDETNKSEFGDGLAELEKFCSSPKNVEQVLQRSPIAHLIIREHENGSQAIAHKLLLREAAFMRSIQEREQAQGKKSKSVPADPGGPGRAKDVKASAATVEEAFEESEREHGQ